MRVLGLLLAASALLGAGIASALPAPLDVVLYNATPSVPVGLYLRRQEEVSALAHGDFVTVRARDVAAGAAAARGFDGRFLKRVAGLSGDHVCVEGDALVINGARRVARRVVDSAGAPLVGWMGCRVLGRDEVLVLGDSADSFDGRYWGPVSVGLIEGVWEPL